MRFEFATVPRIVFGPGTLSEAGKIASDWGPRVLIVAGKELQRAGKLAASLSASGLEHRLFSVGHEPSISVVLEGLRVAQAFGATSLVGHGGGSVIDTAKAIAGLATNPGDPLDYLEVVGSERPLENAALPWMAIPTTSGTGAEVTRNAVLSVPEHRVKVSLRSPRLLARVALVDPELTLGLPRDVTASTGLDALTQLIEAYLSVRATPMTDALCAEAIPRVSRALPIAWSEPEALPARTDMAFGSLSSGIALANAGLGAVHGCASPLGGMFDAPHGAVCAALLAPVMEANFKAAKRRSATHAAIPRFVRVAQWLTANEQATAMDGIKWLHELVTTFQIPKLRHYGVAAADLDEIVTRAQRASSTKGNPIVLEASELRDALAEAL